MEGDDDDDDDDDDDPFMIQCDIHTHTHTHTRGVSTGYCQNNWKININLSILFLVKKEKIKGRIFTGYCLWALC